MSRGLFISFEGGEGSGKTTQITKLAAALKEKGREVVTTREPGGTPDAEKIRSILVQRDGGMWSPLAECLLLYAARLMHVDTLIRPALERGAIVISDRFADSTRAYQSFGHGFARQKVEDLNALVLGDFRPNLTFILDIEARAGLSRSAKRLKEQNSTEDRFERLDVGFHERLREGYLQIAREEPDRCHIIDAMKSPDDMAREILDIAESKLQ